MHLQRNTEDVQNITQSQNEEVGEEGGREEGRKGEKIKRAGGTKGEKVRQRHSTYPRQRQEQIHRPKRHSRETITGTEIQILRRF